MYRITTVGSLPLGLSRRLLAQCCSLFVGLLFLCAPAFFGGLSLRAQGTAGGGIQGTITDPSGAIVRDAEVTATNTDTGVATTRKSGNSGTYSIQPLQPGNYNLEVVAKGFQRLLQENVTVDNATVVGYNPKLTIGGGNETVTVTDAPPFLDTQDATLGGTIENELYSQLPLSMNGGPRDPTAFQYLMPGVQENPNNNSGTGTTQDIGQGNTAGNGTSSGNSGIVGGTGQTNLTENYLEGVPISNAAQQGSNTPLSSAISVDAVDQFSVQTSGASTSFGGAGSSNYTIKAGGNQFHGTVFDFIRNTMFDTWGYFSKVPATTTGLAEKPGEHQNNYGGDLAGPILKDKLFFFGAYEGYHFTAISNTPQYITIPTLNDRAGNFTDQFGTTLPSIADATAPFGSRTPYQGLLNGVPTYNVISPSQMSSISLYLQKALPPPTNLSTFSNYLANLPQENSDYKIDVRVDYTLNSRNKFEVLGVGGLVGYGNQPFYNNQSQLPVPYAAGQFTSQKTASGVLSYTYIASQTIINSLKYGYSRNWGQGFSLTQGTPYTSTAAGINNLPAGNASASMPSVTFSHTNFSGTEPTNWSSNSNTGPQATNTYSIVDNLTWVKNRHNITFGISVQWDETNAGSFGGYSKALSLTFNDYSTEVSTSNTGFTNGQGYSYASFLAGAVSTGNVTTQAIQDVGGRYRPIEPYIQDNWQVSPKLTLNLGVRYSYLQPYHEVKDRISFLNVNATNPVTGSKGVVEYAGFPNSSTPTAYAPYLCHCTTPVKPYNKNIQPRIGFSYAYTPTTVFSGAFGINLTHAGGVGGGTGATGGTGNSGEFQQGTTWNGIGGSTGTPAFFLNPAIVGAVSANYAPPCQGSQPFNTLGCPGSSAPIACVAAGTCSAYSAIPPYQLAGVTINPLASTGNYNFTSFFPDHLNDYVCQTSDNISCVPQAVNFADPYYGGRGPQFISYNFAMQKLINKKAVLNVAYSGTQTHFLPGGAGRGPATNQFSPDYIQIIKGAYANGGFYGSAPPYPGFTGSNATVAQSLKPFPQYGTMTDLWGDTGNSSYNSLQISVVQRQWHNISGLINYTRGKQIDDTGIHRSQWPIGPQDGNFLKQYGANQIDRALGGNSQLNAINIAGNYHLPIGRGQAFFATNRIAGLIGGGWEVNGIYKYRDGYPLTISNGGGCMTNTVDGGTCLPDYSPGFDKRQARINGRWGRGPGTNATNFASTTYLNTAAFQCADSSPLNRTYSCGATTEPNTTFKIGNVARTAPDGIHGPGWWDIDMGIRRDFSLRETATLHLHFQVEADATNITNSTFFNIATTSGAVVWDTNAYGTVSGQNKSILPRDWQFAGRLTF